MDCPGWEKGRCACAGDGWRMDRVAALQRHGYAAIVVSFGWLAWASSSCLMVGQLWIRRQLAASFRDGPRSCLSCSTARGNVRRWSRRDGVAQRGSSSSRVALFGDVRWRISARLRSAPFRYVAHAPAFQRPWLALCPSTIDEHVEPCRMKKRRVPRLPSVLLP